MEVPGIPSVIIRKMSWSVGVLFAVVRTLYSPLVKSRGRGASCSARPFHPPSPMTKKALPLINGLPRLRIALRQNGGDIRGERQRGRKARAQDQPYRQRLE